MEAPISREELIEKIEMHENISNVDTSEIVDMSEMFCVVPEQEIDRGLGFNQPLNKWDVSKVNDMHGMFWDATSFNQLLNDWDVSNVANMSGMFCEATSFNHPLNDWDVSNVESMSGMFCGAKKFQPAFE